MDHIYPGLFEPMQEVIENLISLPKKYRGISRRSEQMLLLTEKEEELKTLEKSLAARTERLSEAEQSLAMRRDTGRIRLIPVGSILTNPNQPRRTFEDLALFSLAESIREHGILQPLTVRSLKRTVTEELSDHEQYELIAGERRLRAACSVHMECVPCIVLDADNRRAAELALIENLQRESLNMFEAAGAVAALIDIHAMTQEQIAKSLSCSQSAIANKLRILRLTEEERDIILSHHLTERHARAFLRIRDLANRKNVVRYTAEHHLNVARTEQYIDRILSETEQTFGVSAETSSPAASTTAVQPQSPKRKLVLKDVGLFFNTVDRALSAVREAGIPATEDRTETESEIRLTIIVPRMPV